LQAPIGFIESVHPDGRAGNRAAAFDTAAETWLVCWTVARWNVDLVTPPVSLQLPPRRLRRMRSGVPRRNAPDIAHAIV